MSARSSKGQSNQRPQPSTSENMPSTTPSTPPPMRKAPHSPSARDKSYESVNRPSTVIESRIEKGRMTHGNKNPAPSLIATASEVLIRVLINNRLGVRTEILCSPSDTIGAFKRVAAVYLGTRPEAMMLKRQGERPFKDSLTLEDYEIGNESSLDLEIDTGDS